MKTYLLNSAILGLLLITVSISNTAIAGLIENTDNDSFIDLSTGIEWMDFGINNGESYDYVSSQTIVGGEYEGWQLATSNQVYQMWANAFLGLNSNFENPDFFGVGQLKVVDGMRKDGSVFSPIFEAMGFNTVIDLYSADTRYSKGMFEGINGLSFVEAKERIGMYNNWLDDDIVQIIDSSNNDYYKQNGHVEFSTMLVKTNEVPEPSTLAIFALAMMGLLSHQTKREVR